MQGLTMRSSQPLTRHKNFRIMTSSLQSVAQLGFFQRWLSLFSLDRIVHDTLCLPRFCGPDRCIPILRELAKSKDEVWYYREAPENDPHPNALKVLAAFVDQNLPIRLFSKPDYSDTIDDKGRSVPSK